MKNFNLLSMGIIVISILTMLLGDDKIFHEGIKMSIGLGATFLGGITIAVNHFTRDYHEHE